MQLMWEVHFCWSKECELTVLLFHAAAASQSTVEVEKVPAYTACPDYLCAEERPPAFNPAWEAPEIEGGMTISCVTS